MLKGMLTNVFGTRHERERKRVQPIVNEINEEYERLQSVSEEELEARPRGSAGGFARRQVSSRRRIAELKEQKRATDAGRARADRLELGGADGRGGVEGELRDGDSRSPRRDSARGVRHSSRSGATASRNDGDGDRAGAEWNMVHYDVQLMGGIELHLGRIAEMATGEGKTLVATLPLYLNALPGRARTRHGQLVPGPPRLAVDGASLHATSDSPSAASTTRSRGRRSDARHTSRDITYGTNNEFGFDYLRDNMVVSLEQRVQRPHVVRDRRRSRLGADRRSTNAADHLGPSRERERRGCTPSITRR